jgi:hypothetical protein
LEVNKWEWRQLHIGELNYFSALNIIRVIKSRRMGWVGHVTGMGGMRNAYKIWLNSFWEQLSWVTYMYMGGY